jgi:O-antigen biosynthesis protein WbqP
MKRFFDLLVAILLMVPAALLGIVIAVLVRITSPGPALFRTERVGRNNELFTMYKFRTMRTDTPQVATHLLENPDAFVTPVGRLLRRTSLDELPQLINVLRGNMSLVGPRPALFNQRDLVQSRTERGVHRLVPGITGWAQVNGRDELPIGAKVDLDADYLAKRSLLLDLRILVRTVAQSITGRGVSH